MPWGAVAVAGASIIGGALQANAAGDAASQQAGAADRATQAQIQMYNQERSDLAPYTSNGSNALNSLGSLTGVGTSNPLTSPLLASFQPTEAQLTQTPGYKFNLTQGLKAVQNSATANGNGVSGNALAGAAQYATGLADSTYQNQYNNYVTNQTNQYNRLLAQAQLGQASAAGVGAAGVQTGANIGSNIIGAGNAGAAASIAQGNAFSNAASGLSSAALINQYANSQNSNSLFGSNSSYVNNPNNSTPNYYQNQSYDVNGSGTGPN